MCPTWANAVLYATYVTFECVWPILIKTFTPKFTMSFAILSFGVITICTAWAGNFGGLVALRLMLGFSEAGVVGHLVCPSKESRAWLTDLSTLAVPLHCCLLFDDLVSCDYGFGSERDWS